MTGLRERKKQELRHRIIREAITLFAEEGLDVTTMEEIAAAADVSVGTVYNYFGSKGALLLAGVEEDTDRMVTAGVAVVEAPGDDVVAAVQRLTRVYLDDFATWDKRLLREVLGAAYQRSSGPELTQELARMDQRLIEQTMVLLSHFQDRRQLADGVEVYEAALIILSVFVLQLFMFISLETYERSDLYEQVDRQIELVFAGLTASKKRK
jgi:AcrR family transcriptional regulator